MASRHHTRSYDKATLALLEQAFADTWMMLRNRDPFRDWDKDSQLKGDLTDELMELVDEGVADPAPSLDWLLRAFPHASKCWERA